MLIIKTHYSCSYYLSLLNSKSLKRNLLLRPGCKNRPLNQTWYSKKSLNTAILFLCSFYLHGKLREKYKNNWAGLSYSLYFTEFSFLISLNLDAPHFITLNTVFLQSLIIDLYTHYLDQKSLVSQIKHLSKK